MTRGERSRGYRIGLALILAIICLFVAYACVRSTLLRLLPAESPILTRGIPHSPDVVLAHATRVLVADHGIVKPVTLAAVRRAAQGAPLDARAFVVLGHQMLLDGEEQRAVKTLEAGQRLDPRNRLIHLLLLDRYLRANRYADAASQFAVSARLVGPAQTAIAEAMAQMSVAPETRDAVRQTLANDPELERSVLAALAKSNTAPATIFAIASPRAQADASSWGQMLVDRLINQKRFGAARDVWRRIYRLDSAQLARPIYDAGFRGLPGAPPFNWTRVASGIGAADLLNGTLSVNYYGRDTGELAGQLLVLAPGTYRFAVTVEGAKTGTGPSLTWSLRCANAANTEVLALLAPGTGKPNRIAAGFTIPAGCAAQRLALIGNTGEFPGAVTLTLRDLDVRPAGAQ